MCVQIEEQLRISGYNQEDSKTGIVCVGAPYISMGNHRSKIHYDVSFKAYIHMYVKLIVVYKNMWLEQIVRRSIDIMSVNMAYTFSYLLNNN